MAASLAAPVPLNITGKASIVDGVLAWADFFKSDGQRPSGDYCELGMATLLAQNTQMVL
jgi:hypothetical protein